MTVSAQEDIADEILCDTQKISEMVSNVKQTIKTTFDEKGLTNNSMKNNITYYILKVMANHMEETGMIPINAKKNLNAFFKKNSLLENIPENTTIH